MEGRDLLCCKDILPVYARDGTAMDCALGYNNTGKPLPGSLLQLLRGMGAKTGAECGGRASYWIRGGGSGGDEGISGGGGSGGGGGGE